MRWRKSPYLLKNPKFETRINNIGDLLWVICKKNTNNKSPTTNNTGIPRTLAVGSVN
jgi:hypothetical protein